MKVIQLQTHVSEKKEENINRLWNLMNQIQQENADLIALGEMFNCPYEAGKFPLYAEPEGGDTWRQLSRMAKECHAYFSAGSVPETDSKGRVYNTAYVFDREGRQIARHRKAHLFDVDIKGRQTFRESDTLSAGNEITVFDTEFGKMGLGICYDIRFPEYSRLLVEKGARIILMPAAFNMTTGPAHWRINFCGRALDNQSFYIGTSVARDEKSSYVAWGHSIITSPWGDIVSEMDEKPGIMINEIDLATVDKVRSELPLLASRRGDLYALTQRRV